MKWRSKIYKSGDKLTHSFFAIYPVIADDGKFRETRWLERVTVEKEWVEEWEFFGWKNIKFIDKK